MIGLRRRLKESFKIRILRLREKNFNFLTEGKLNKQSLDAVSKKRGGFACSSQHAQYLLFRPEQWPLLTVSIVTYNSEKWLTNFIDSICNQDYPKKRLFICFVDHGSTDGTLEFLERFRDEMHVGFAGIQISQRPNRGYGAGHDYVLRNASTERVLVTNVDLEFLSDTITKLVSHAEADSDDVACWEAYQLPYEHPKYYDPVTFETGWNSHSCVLIDRDKYVEVGGYEKLIFMYGEDVELSYRFRSFGYILRYVPDAKVYHHTYDFAGEVKRLQFAGSTLANIYIRLRYGSYSDVFVGYLLQLWLLIIGAGFKGGRRIVANNILKSMIRAPSLLNSRNKIKANFSFCGYDYDMARNGAFYVNEPRASNEVPLISVITRTIEGRGFLLRECIASVLNQTYPNIEHLVVEDGGSSASGLVDKVCHTFKNKEDYSIRHISAPKKGRSHAGNIGLANARGEYFVFLDDDDLLYPDHIDVLYAAIIKENANAAYSIAWEALTDIDINSNSYEEYKYQTLPGMQQEFDKDILFVRNYLPLQCVLFSRSFYERCGGFDEDMDYLEDWLLWCRFAVENDFIYVSKTTSIYRTPYDLEKRVERSRLLNQACSSAKKRIDDIVEQASNS